MAPTRSNLKLDEESFEALLLAAYTVQEHNAKRTRTPASQVACPRCGSILDGYQFCGKCGTRGEELRPGERLQRNWASLWLMSQNLDKDLAPSVEDTASAAPGNGEPVRDIFPADWHDEFSDDSTDMVEDGVKDFDDEPSLLPWRGVVSETQLVIAGPPESPASQSLPRPSLSIRFRREDLYLALAIAVSVVALSWAIWAGPLTRSGGSRLGLWQRTLVNLGVAEPPEKAAVYRGDPSAKVWADPHTALYYCYGAEQFGKTPNGHFSTQREAQMDRFSPAARTPCE